MNKEVLIIRDESFGEFFDSFFLNENNRKVCFIDSNKKDLKYLLKNFLENKKFSYVLIFPKEWNPMMYRSLDAVLEDYDVPWIYITQFFNKILIGPFRNSKQKGCLDCLYYRWFMTKKDRINLFELKKCLSEGHNVKISGDLLNASMVGLAITLAFKLINNEVSEFSYIIDKKTLRFNGHNFLPNPHCQVCGHMDNDEKRLIEHKFFTALNDNTLKEKKGNRFLSKEYLEDTLSKNFLDVETGIFNKLLDDYESPFAVSVANLPLKVGKDEVGVGRTDNYANSHLTAILEGIERYCGMEPRGNRTNVFGSYNELMENALNPSVLGLHAEEQYQLKRFPFNKYNPDKKMKWVWGYSFNKNKAILVPETYAYYGTNYRDGVQNSFVYEISNGCALGGHLLEATLQGIYEVVERDAFLISWYTKLPLKRIRKESIKDQTIQLLLTRFEYQTDYDIHLYNMTLENKIPTILAIAKNRGAFGMNILCAAGCHLDINKAIESSLHELCGILEAIKSKFENRKSELYEMAKNYSLVRTMEVHSLLFGLKELEKEFDFLLKSPIEIDLSEVEPLKYSNNIHTDLLNVIDYFKKINLDIIVVDQTAEDIKFNNLYCVKVIIPGMLPMTFGHDMRRIHNLPRIFRVPRELGHKIKNENEIKNNQVTPHPFP
ncbi:TOMM precursor leader peptide-binding protein [Bacillus cereus]|uniref:TOMM precursor leader peptide-binding protein n=1 Tax=Bacillus cereus TaxID=1396 RepID=UPI0024BCC40F|nr:TOMM precursor leader peptide-binding protein [Bacillus cereus]